MVCNILSGGTNFRYYNSCHDNTSTIVKGVNLTSLTPLATVTLYSVTVLWNFGTSFQGTTFDFFKSVLSIVCVVLLL